MTQVVLLVYPNVLASHLAAMAELFYFANKLAAVLSPELPTPYQVQFYSLTADHQYQAGAVTLQCVTQLERRPDLIIVAGNDCHQVAELIALRQWFEQQTPWFLHQAEQGALFAGACNGVFGLASTGLLDGGCATTCWFLAEFFQQQFPQIKLAVEEQVAVSGSCITAGATTAYIPLCLSLIARYSGQRFAAQLGKILLQDSANRKQAPFLSVQQLITHRDDKISRVQQYLRDNLAQSHDLSLLAEHFAMSPRTLIRRFKQATGETPMAWLQKLRIDKAKELLEYSDVSLEDIVLQVGYEDTSSFRKLFQHYTKMSPKAYRQHFNVSAA